MITLRMFAVGMLILTAYGCAEPSEGDDAASSTQQQTAGVRVSVDCTLSVGDETTRLAGTGSTLTGRVAGFEGSVMGDDSGNFAVFHVYIDVADGKPIARATATPETLAATGGTALHYMNKSRYDEVLIKCTAR